jgi:hypothetical protein
MKKKETKEELYVVFAHSGRFNGSAVVSATSKTEARKKARSCGWLELGTVDSAIKATEDQDVSENLEDFTATVKENGYAEIDWGT